MPERSRHDAINPYIALADVYMNLGVAFVMFALLFMLLGHRGWDDIRYREEQKQFSKSVQMSPELAAKVRLANRNDAPGEQRWMFPSYILFAGDSTQLTPRGRRILGEFAKVLLENRELWWRVRIEAHARQRVRQAWASEERAAFALTGMRAVEVASFLQYARIPPYRIVASGRGHQDLYDPLNRTSAVNDRVDVLVIPPSAQQRLQAKRGQAAVATP
jgi:outer membrane protein OmpA-like peptidoglycan-associated protein